MQILIDGNPVGLATSLTTGAAGSGTYTIHLEHEPEKSASGVASGDIYIGWWEKQIFLLPLR